jgi:hypothetical protein
VEEQESAQSVTNTIRTMRALALTLAAVAAVSACGGSSGEPRTALPVSASPTASPTPAAGAVPPDAKAADKEGAAAFARFFYAQTVVAFANKNPDLIKAISAPGCSACENYVRSLTKLRDNKERVDNFSVTVTSALVPSVTASAARVDVSWTSPEIAIRYDAAGKEIFRDGPYKRVDDQVNLVRQRDGWLVAAIKPIRTVK